MKGNIPASEPLKLAVERAASEMIGMYLRLERLEYGLDMVFVHNSGTLDGKAVNMLQELDVLRQSLCALGDYLSLLAKETDDAGCVDQKKALEAIPLRDMANRLSGRDEVEIISGFPELF